MRWSHLKRVGREPPETRRLSDGGFRSPAAIYDDTSNPFVQFSDTLGADIPALKTDDVSHTVAKDA